MKTILKLLFGLAFLFIGQVNADNYNILDHPASTFVYTGVLSGIPATCTAGTLVFITNAAAGQQIYECSATNTWTQQLNSGAGGAGAALDNLSAVNINTSLLAQTGVDFGSAAKPFRNLFLWGTGTYGTTSIELTGVPTGVRVAIFPDSNTTIPIAAQQLTFSGPTAARTYTLPDAAATLLYSGGALGTPSSGTGTNLTGVPISTGVSGLGASVATFLATPSSANLLSAITTSTGSGNLVFATSPILVTPTLGVASATTLAVTGSTAPANGIYLVAANDVGIAVNSTKAMDCTTATCTFAPNIVAPNLIASGTLVNGGICTYASSGSLINCNTVGTVGTTTNDNAQAGSVGEEINSIVASPGSSQTTGTPINVTSISLTAGDWEVSGAVGFIPAATTSVTQLQVGVTTTSATVPALGNNLLAQLSHAAAVDVNPSVINVGPTRFSFASTTTVYLVANAVFTVSTMTDYGTIRARRAR